jgi:hypothetical protein
MTDISCPMCNQQFDERAIQIHAFSCAGQPSQMMDSDDASDFEKDFSSSSVLAETTTPPKTPYNSPASGKRTAPIMLIEDAREEKKVKIEETKLQSTVAPVAAVVLCVCLQLIENGLMYSQSREDMELLQNIRESIGTLVEAYEDEIYCIRKQTQKQATEFSEIRVQLEQAQSILTGKQQEELTKIRKEELERRQKEIEQEKKRLNDDFLVQKSMLYQNTTPLLPGEKEALEGNCVKYFSLYPNQMHNTSPASIHFRIAESAFYRLSLSTGSARVTQVEYVVNPILFAQFNAAREKEPSLKPLLVFHGTNASNIQSICSNGFRAPGDADYKMVNGLVKGPGVYFAESVSTSLSYNVGGDKMLLCQILARPSEDKSTGVWVITNSERTLPTYILHFKNMVISDPAHFYKK